MVSGWRGSYARWRCVLSVVIGGLALLGVARGEWAVSLPGWQYEFPRDHGNHADYKTEWWYFTGNLRAEGGREFGYQLTFFRQGITPPSDRTASESRFVAGDVYFVHFAVTDLARQKFRGSQILSRGAYGEAGVAESGRVAWVETCEVRTLGDANDFQIVGEDGGARLELTLRSAKPPVMHGADGVSQKAAGEGRASHYYSLTHLESTGSITLDGEEFAVEGTSWFDHEWATNQLEENQVGWDWLSLQLTDGTELMLFQIRERDGGRSPYSSGTFVRVDGTSEAIGEGEFTMEAGRTWTGPETGADYPVEWRVAVPKLGLELAVAARMDAQEQVLEPISYWEGSVAAEGTAEGVGYLEMTGYGSEVVGMSAGMGGD